MFSAVFDLFVHHFGCFPFGGLTAYRRLRCPTIPSCGELEPFSKVMATITTKPFKKLKIDDDNLCQNGEKLISIKFKNS